MIGVTHVPCVRVASRRAYHHPRPPEAGARGPRRPVPQRPQRRDGAARPTGAGPPIGIAAGGPRTMRLAVEFADEWNWWTMPRPTAESIRPKLDELQRACEEVGRDPDTLDVRWTCTSPPRLREAAPVPPLPATSRPLRPPRVRAGGDRGGAVLPTPPRDPRRGGLIHPPAVTGRRARSRRLNRAGAPGRPASVVSQPVDQAEDADDDEVARDDEVQ